MTDRVNAKVTPGMDDGQANVARRKAMADIEKKALDATGLRSDVVTLYQGGKYALYTSKKYTDVRLVFAPEFAIAFFGGDPDNFEYPRYDLDVCFFRAYEDGKPAKVEHHLKWSKGGSKAGDLVFVAGHPGKTESAEHPGAPGIPPRRGLPLPAGSPPRSRAIFDRVRQEGRGAGQAGEGGPLRHPEQPQGPHRRPRRPEGCRLHGAEGRQRGRASRQDQGRPRAPGRLRPRVGQDRRGAGRRVEGPQAVQLRRARAGVRLAPLPVRPHPRPPGRGEGQAQPRPPPRISRVEPRIAQAGPLLRRPHLSRIREGQAGPLARLLEEDDGRRRPPRRESPPGPIARGGRRRAGRRLQARQRLRPQGAGRGRPQGARSLGRPDDQAGPGRGRRGPRPPQDAARTRSRASRPRNTL